jgi:hypothetical protein
MQSHFFHVRAADEGVAVEMSGDVARFLRVTAAMLVHNLEGGITWPYRSLRAGRVFPSAYPDRRDSGGFRHRHTAALREHIAGAGRRVLAGWDGSRTVSLDDDAVRDWFIVYGHARMLYSRRPWWTWTRPIFDGVRPPKSKIVANLVWLRMVRDHLAKAIVSPPGCSCTQ